MCRFVFQKSEYVVSRHFITVELMKNYFERAPAAGS